MKTRLFLVLTVGLAGCDALLARPGDDFHASVAHEEVRLVQAVDAYDLEFGVDGCDDFNAEIDVPGASRTRLEPKALGDGRFTARVPIERLAPPDEYCLYDSEQPRVSPVSLEIQCKQDGRTTRSNFRVTYAPAWRVTPRTRGPVDAVFAGPSPERFFEVGSGWLDAVDGKKIERDDVASTSPLEPPLLAAFGSTVHLWSACPINDCGSFPVVDTPKLKVFNAATFLQQFDWAREGGDRRSVKVPAGAVDMVAESGGVVLVSLTTTSVAITRVVGEAVSVVAYLEGETHPTKIGTLDGAHVFLTRVVDDRAVRLRRTDGTLLAELPLPGSGEVSHLSFAPTGDAWVTIRGGQAWISTLDRGGAWTASSAPLATELIRFAQQSMDDASFGAGWTTSGVVLRDATGVELFARAAPFARRWKQSLGANAQIRGAMGVGESVAVLTASGLRIFDLEGRFVGGADPLPPACRRDYYARHMAVIGPDVVALAGSRSTFQFRAGLGTTNGR